MPDSELREYLDLIFRAVQDFDTKQVFPTTEQLAAATGYPEPSVVIALDQLSREGRVGQRQGAWYVVFDSLCAQAAALADAAVASTAAPPMDAAAEALASEEAQRVEQIINKSRPFGDLSFECLSILSVMDRLPSRNESIDDGQLYHAAVRQWPLGTSIDRERFGSALARLEESELVRRTEDGERWKPRNV